VATKLRERTETGCRGRQCSMNLEGGGMQEDQGNNGGTNVTLRVKEQTLNLTLQSS